MYSYLIYLILMTQFKPHTAPGVFEESLHGLFQNRPDRPARSSSVPSSLFGFALVAGTCHEKLCHLYISLCQSSRGIREVMGL